MRRLEIAGLEIENLNLRGNKEKAISSSRRKMKFIATLNSLNNNLYLIGEKSDELDILYSLKYNLGVVI